MSTRVGILKGVIVDIAIPIQALRVPKIRHHRIRGDEATDAAAVIPRVVIVKSEAGFVT